MAKTEHRIDMLNGPLVKNIIIFTIPLILSALLQHLYHAADMVILGQFSSITNGVAAVGATGSISNLAINVFLGLAVGVNVVASRNFGKQDMKGMKNIVHTAVTVSVIGGTVLGILSIIFARPILVLMDTPEDIIDLSVLYMRIYFAGLPAQMLYNFGAAILRSIGETKKPLYILTFSGLINVAFNLFFVIVCHMDVDGVAYATVISQVFSAVMILVYLSKLDESYRLHAKSLCIRKKEFFATVRYGLPAGVQTALFSLSNVIIQTQVNAHGTDAVNGNTASGNIESFLYTTMFQFSVAALTFSSQNIGAKRPEMIRKINRTCSLLVLAVGIFGGAIYLIFGRALCGFYLPHSPIGVELGYLRLSLIAYTYFTIGLLDAVVGVIRSMGYSFTSMMISIAGICGVRIGWVYTVYEAFDKDIFVLWICYPVSWIVSLAAQYVLYWYARKKTEKKLYESIEKEKAKQLAEA